MELRDWTRQNRKKWQIYVCHLKLLQINQDQCWDAEESVYHNWVVSYRGVHIINIHNSMLGNKINPRKKEEPEIKIKIANRSI